MKTKINYHNTIIQVTLSYGKHDKEDIISDIDNHFNELKKEYKNIAYDVAGELEEFENGGVILSGNEYEKARQSFDWTNKMSHQHLNVFKEIINNNIFTEGNQKRLLELTKQVYDNTDSLTKTSKLIAKKICETKVIKTLISNQIKNENINSIEKHVLNKTNWNSKNSFFNEYLLPTIEKTLKENLITKEKNEQTK